MSAATGQPQGRRRGGCADVAHVACAAAFLLAIVLVGCTAQKQYKVLSIFFDGVPDPNAPKTSLLLASVVGEDERRPIKLAVVHKPYADGNCAACHVASKATGNSKDPAAGFRNIKELKLVSLDSDLCVRCHAEKPGQFKVMHGPVATTACMWCHEPHQSNSPSLLKSKGADLCLQCHDRQLLTRQAIGHLAEEKACLDCHVGHGGPNSNLLRPATVRRSPGAASTQPTLAALAPGSTGAEAAP